MRLVLSGAIILALGCLTAAPIVAQTTADMVADGSNPQIDYAAYHDLVAEVEPVRAQRQVLLLSCHRRPG